MKTYFKYLYIMAAQVFLSCESLVEIAPPQDYLISSTIFESDETATSATTGLYATMMNGELRLPYHIALYTGMYSDELSYDQTQPGLLALYKYSLLSQDALTNSIWNNGFNYIYQANSILEGLERSNNISAAVKNQLIGEALFIRGFWNYYLSIFYGRLPLILTTDYTTNAKLSQSDESVIEQQILEDLKNAKQLLSEKYVGANSISESNDRIRPNSFVASALLSRIYLKRKEYQKAIDETSGIISSAKFAIADINSVFKRNSKEVIWQLELPVNTSFNNSYEANMFPLQSKPNPFGTNQCSFLSADLLSLFAANDKRKTAWMGNYIDNSVTPSVVYTFPAKLRSKSLPADEYTTPFRIAEIYLIRAESYAQLEQIEDAIDDTDKVRFRAGLNLIKDMLPRITKSALLDSIDIEKRRELFCEWGIRWTDIRKSDTFNETMNSIAEAKSTPWKSSSILWPIPLNEVMNSGKNLKQNDGYN